MATDRTITLVTKKESGPPSFTDKLERWTKILSIAAIPVILGIGGWLVQNFQTARTLNKDYVYIAISILSDEEKFERENLREWAVALLEKTSPSPLPKKLAADLRSGLAQVKLPRLPVGVGAPTLPLMSTSDATQMIAYATSNQVEPPDWIKALNTVSLVSAEMAAQSKSEKKALERALSELKKFRDTAVERRFSTSLVKEYIAHEGSIEQIPDPAQRQRLLEVQSWLNDNLTTNP